MSAAWQTACFGASVIFAAMLLLWLVSIRLQDVSIVDPFWGTGFVILAWITLALQPVWHARLLMMVALVTLWGIRLSIYLLWRNSGRGEDSRYASMRQLHGRRFWWVSYWTVFLLQAVLMWIVAIPIFMATLSPDQRPNVLDLCGVLLWCVGMYFEAIGDWQMARFRADPANRGKVMRHGLWNYTRHPNYFGDFCVWWGFYLIAAGGGAWWTIFSPILMSILLMRVSGVTLLESTIVERRPDYADYQRTTSAFFPWFPGTHL